MRVSKTLNAFGGVLSVCTRTSTTLSCPTEFAVFLPQQAEDGPVPCLWFLSGLTCTWANVMEKGGILRSAAEHGLAIVAPDTSPRGDSVADDEGYDLGQGAGFYLTATEDPWAQHYRMDRYITEELQDRITAEFPIDRDRQGVTGHSMGGHGALTLHLKNPQLYKSVSAFAPITNPIAVPWGKKAFGAYLGTDEARWAAYDATHLVAERPSAAPILIDQGTSDQFLTEQLDPTAFEAAASAAGQPFTLRRQEGYDHSYYFVATFMDDHVRHHAEQLKP